MADKMKHTPGEWLIEHSGTFALPITDSDGDYVCAVSERSAPGETLANAYLIAAAPELFEACRRAHLFIQNGIELGYVRMPDADSGDPALETPDVIRAALAKALNG